MACLRAGLVLLCVVVFIFRPTSAIDGTVTLYGGPQDGGNPDVASNGVLDGSCGYGALDRSEWPNWMAAAIGPSNPLTSGGNPGGCGACVEVTCTSGCSSTASPATVLITDTCPSCAPTQINVQALTFQKYFQSNLALGQVQATWQQVPCNPPGNIEIVVSNSRSTLGGYLVLTLQQVAGTGRISNVEFQASGSQGFVPMTNFFGNAYQISNFGAPPFSLRITGQGQTLIASNAITAVQDGKYPTQIQFGRSSTTAQGPPPASLARAPPPVVPLAPPPLAQNPPPAPPPAQTPIRSAPPAPPPATPVSTPRGSLPPSPEQNRTPVSSQDPQPLNIIPPSPPPAPTGRVPTPPTQGPPLAPATPFPTPTAPPTPVPSPQAPNAQPGFQIPMAAPVVTLNSSPNNPLAQNGRPASSPEILIPGIISSPQGLAPRALPPTSIPSAPAPLVQAPAPAPRQEIPSPSLLDALQNQAEVSPRPQGPALPSPAPALPAPTTPTPANPAPSPSPPLTTVRVPISSPVPASNATRNSTSPSPSLALSPAPNSSNLTAPAPSTGIVQRNISSSPAPANQSTALAPGELTLSVNSGLSGEEANAANEVVNPAISVSAGRRLTSFGST